MLHRFPDGAGFEEKLQRSQLEYVVGSEAAATTLAENYVGLGTSMGGLILPPAYADDAASRPALDHARVPLDRPAASVPAADRGAADADRADRARCSATAASGPPTPT